VTEVTTAATPRARALRLNSYLTFVFVLSVGVGVLAWFATPRPDFGPLALLCGMGILSFQLREYDVGSRIGFSFLSIILVASAAIVGVFGSWLIGFVSLSIDRRQLRWSATVFNMAMTGLLGASIAQAYRIFGGVEQVDEVVGAANLTLHVGVPLFAADIVGCIVNAALLAGVMHFHQRVPFGVLLRRVLEGSGLAYIGYGLIGFLFVVLWFPADLGPFSALLVMAPLLSARWAFIQYGDELRSHERTIDTLVTALGTKEPAAVERSRRAAVLAEWVAEELGLSPHQIGTVRHAATLHEIGHLGVPTRLLRRAPESLTPAEQRVIDRHCVVGARMIEGIDFLEDARSGIRHQQERFDGGGRPDGLAGPEIPVAARVVAVVIGVEALTASSGPPTTPTDIFRRLTEDRGRYDPAIVSAAWGALEKHGWPAVVPSEVVT
jgi:HD-GYP domain-containing protein (c-di-GMP phosphodiesterase class II)